MNLITLKLILIKKSTNLTHILFLSIRFSIRIFHNKFNKHSTLHFHHTNYHHLKKKKKRKLLASISMYFLVHTHLETYKEYGINFSNSNNIYLPSPNRKDRSIKLPYCHISTDLNFEQKRKLHRSDDPFLKSHHSLFESIVARSNQTPFRGDVAFGEQFWYPGTIGFLGAFKGCPVCNVRIA